MNGYEIITKQTLADMLSVRKEVLDLYVEEEYHTRKATEAATEAHGFLAATTDQATEMVSTIFLRDLDKHSALDAKLW